jgi:hypothetical protein
LAGATVVVLDGVVAVVDEVGSEVGGVVEVGGVEWWVM